MRRIFLIVLCVCVLAGLTLAQSKKAAPAAAKPDFEIAASYIESCSCTMFCSCYFSPNEPSPHHWEGSKHFCRANLVMKVDKGHYKNTKLDGVKVWIANDLGGEFAKGKPADWLVLTFDPSVSKEQQAAMQDILLQLYPLHQKSRHLGVDTVPIEWNVDLQKGAAVARLANGKGETILERVSGDDSKKEVVIHNLKYWGAQSNTGFRLWGAKRNYYEGHGQKYDTRGTNGFLITINFSGQATKSTAD